MIFGNYWLVSKYQLDQSYNQSCQVKKSRSVKLAEISSTFEKGQKWPSGQIILTLVNSFKKA